MPTSVVLANTKTKMDAPVHSSGNEQLMGNQPGQLNLRAQRQRALELAELIDALLTQLRFAPHTLNWNDVVDKMAVVNVQLHQLQDELRPVSHHYVLHPKSVNAQNAGTIPVMLATMPYPEQQARWEEVARGETTSYEQWKEFVESVCAGNTRKAARRRAGRRGGVEGAGSGSGAFAVVSPPTLDDAEQELLNIVSFGGLHE